MKKYDAVEVIATFELSGIVNKEATIDGLLSIIKKMYEENYQDVGKVRLTGLSVVKDKVYYK